MKLFFILLLWAARASAVTAPTLLGTPTTSTVVVTGASAFTFSHVVPSGSNVVLFAQGFATTTVGNKPASSATFNGVAMTLLKSSYITQGALTNQSDVFYLKNPQATTANIIINFPASVNQLGGNAINYAGVDQTIVYASTSATAITASPANVTTTVTTLYDNSLLLENWAAYAVGPGAVQYSKDAAFTDRAYSAYSIGAAGGGIMERAVTSKGAYSAATTFDNGGAAFNSATQQLIELVGVQALVAGQRSGSSYNRQRNYQGPSIVPGLRQ